MDPGRVASAVACVASLLVGSGVTTDPRVARADGSASKKSLTLLDAATVPGAAEGPKLLATLVQIHTAECVPLDAVGPADARFDAMLADGVTGARIALDPRLLGLLRTLAQRHGEKGPVRVELVSGFRSPKRNEAMRKKGHHVASHSQHSLGHAVDFRVLEEGGWKGIDPRVLSKEIRALGWEGGIGFYPSPNDWFVHADVGPERGWRGE